MKKLQITRSSPDHGELVELYKREGNLKLKERYQALYLMIELQNCNKVAELIKKSRNTVQTWAKLFKEGGLKAIAPDSPPGRPSSLSDEQKEELKLDVMTHLRELGYDFSNWEGKSVAEHVHVKFGVSFTTQNAQKLLHALGFSLQRPKYKFPKADPENQEEFVRDFKKIGFSWTKRRSSISRRSERSVLSVYHANVVAERSTAGDLYLWQAETAASHWDGRAPRRQLARGVH